MVQISDYDQPPNPAIDNCINSRPTLPKINAIYLTSRIEPTTWVLWLGLVMIELIVEGNNQSRSDQNLFSARTAWESEQMPQDLLEQIVK